MPKRSLKNKPTKNYPLLSTAKGGSKWKKIGKTTTAFSRPGFSLAKQTAARLEASLATGDNTLLHANLAELDLAAPHRAPYAKLRDTVLSGNAAKIETLVDELSKASEEYEAALKTVVNDKRAADYSKLADLYKKTREDLEGAYKSYKLSLSPLSKQRLVTAMNNLASNAPGLGPHSTANVPVSDRLHINIIDGPVVPPMSPRSRRAFRALPGEATATTTDNSGSSSVVMPSGDLHTLIPDLTYTESVHAKPGILRGSLLAFAGKIYKPRNYKLGTTGNFQQDWDSVT